MPNLIWTQSTDEIATFFLNSSLNQVNVIDTSTVNRQKMATLLLESTRTLLSSSLLVRASSNNFVFFVVVVVVVHWS